MKATITLSAIALASMLTLGGCGTTEDKPKIADKKASHSTSKKDNKDGKKTVYSGKNKAAQHK